MAPPKLDSAGLVQFLGDLEMLQLLGYPVKTLVTVLRAVLVEHEDEFRRVIWGIATSIAFALGVVLYFFWQPYQNFHDNLWESFLPPWLAPIAAVYSAGWLPTFGGEIVWQIERMLTLCFYGHKDYFLTDAQLNKLVQKRQELEPNLQEYEVRDGIIKDFKDCVRHIDEDESEDININKKPWIRAIKAITHGDHEPYHDLKRQEKIDHYVLEQKLKTAELQLADIRRTQSTGILHNTSEPILKARNNMFRNQAAQVIARDVVIPISQEQAQPNEFEEAIEIHTIQAQPQTQLQSQPSTLFASNAAMRLNSSTPVEYYEQQDPNVGTLFSPLSERSNLAGSVYDLWPKFASSVTGRNTDRNVGMNADINNQVVRFTEEEIKRIEEYKKLLERKAAQVRRDLAAHKFRE